MELTMVQHLSKTTPSITHLGQTLANQITTWQLYKILISNKLAKVGQKSLSPFS
jgi:hypothetical protein